MLIVPVILALLFLSVHLAILAHASHVAQLAAQRGAQVAATANGSVSVLRRSVETVNRTIQDLGGNLDSAPQVKQMNRLVGVSVVLRVQGVVPYLPTRVERTVWVTNEEFIMEQDR